MRRHFAVQDYRALLDRSCVVAERMWGLAVHREHNRCTSARAKLVRATFTQHIDTHWSRAPLRRNALRRAARSGG